MKQSAIGTFAVLVFCSAAASAEPEAAEGWFEEQPSEAAETPETSEAEPSEQLPEAAPKPTTQPKIVVVATSSDDPERDQAIEKVERDPSARRHDGLYLRMSLGGGSLAARGDRYDAGYQNRRDYDFEGNAMSFDVMLGGTLTPGLTLGGGYIGTYAARANYSEQEDEDAGMSFGMLGAFVDIYPDPHGGFHLGGMLGPAATVAYDDRYEERATAVGFGGSLWVGYDFWVSDQWSIGGMLRATGAAVETPASRELELPERDRLGVGSVALMFTALYH